MIPLCEKCKVPLPCPCIFEQWKKDKLKEEAEKNIPVGDAYPPKNESGSGWQTGNSSGSVTGGDDSPSQSNNDHAEACAEEDIQDGSCPTCMLSDSDEEEELDSMSFRLSFGRFVEWSGMPSGHLRLYSKELTPQLTDGSLFLYEHISQRRIVARVNSADTSGYANTIALLTERGYLRYASFAWGESEANPFGGSEIYGYERIRMVHPDGSPYCGGVEYAPFFEETLKNGTILRYSGVTGNIVNITTSERVKVSASEFNRQLIITKVNSQGTFVNYSNIKDKLEGADNIYDDRPRQIWNLTDGLLDFPEPGRIDWYSPADVTNDVGENGLFILEEGAKPIRSWNLRVSEEANDQDTSSFEINRESEGALSSVKWKKLDEKGMILIKGEGVEARCVLKIRERLDSPEMAIIRPNGTSVVVNGIPTAHYAETKYTFKSGYIPKNSDDLDSAMIMTSNRTVFQSFEFGTVAICRIFAFGLPGEKTWCYVYCTDSTQADYGKRIKVIKPDSNEITYSFDDQGNQTIVRKPWINGEYREIRKTWMKDRFNDRRLASSSEIHISADGIETVLSTTEFVCEQSDEIKRDIVVRKGLGMNYSEISVTETFLQHDCSYAIGRPRMIMHPDGTETWYHYQDANGQRNLWQVTETHCYNHYVDPGRSTRTIRYIDAYGDIVAIIEQVHNGNDFTTIQSRYLSYDELHRVTRVEYGNGQVETTEWTCCGPLWHTDIDGVQIRYFYNDARQLVREERDAAPILEEYADSHLMQQPSMTVTEYEYDGNGRQTAIVKQIGKFTSRTKMEYDHLGRIVSSIDAVGRRTTYNYSTDGLVTTETLPTGATIISENYENGLLKSATGTGQQHRYYSYEVTSEGIFTRTRINSVNGPIISEEVSDGIGQTIISRIPSANGNGRMIETRTHRNEQGLIYLIESDDKTPIITEYDEYGTSFRQIIKLDKSTDVLTLKDKVQETSVRYITIDSQIPGYPKEIGKDAIFEENIQTIFMPDMSPVVTKNYVLASKIYPELESLTISQDKYGYWSWRKVTGKFKNKRIITKIAGNEYESETVTIDGVITRTTDSSGKVTCYQREYTSTGQIVKTINYNSLTSSVESDVLGRPIKCVATDGSLTIGSYDLATGQISAVTNSLGQQLHLKYDHRGRLTARYGTNVYPIKFEYNDAGLMTAMYTWRVPGGILDDIPKGEVTQWKYDQVSGMLLSKHYADGTQTTYRYHTSGKIACITNESGHSIHYKYKPFTGELIEEIVENNTSTKSSLLINSQTGTIICKPLLDKTDNRRIYNYNLSGQISRVTDEAGVTTYDYDKLGNCIKQTTSTPYNNVEIQYKVDKYGRNSGYQFYLDGMEIQSVDIAYDQMNRIERTTLDRNENFCYGYDAHLGYMNKLTYPNNIEKRIKCADNSLLIEEIGYYDANKDIYVEHMEFDSFGRMSKRKDNLLGIETIKAYSYNNRDEVIGFSLGTENPLLQSALDGLTKEGHSFYKKNGTIGVLKEYEWKYDNIGNRIHEKKNDFALSYYSNPESFINYETNAINQYDNLYTYDMQGNQTMVETHTGRWEIQYNTENRAISYTRHADSTHSNMQIFMTYDHMGRRIEKKVVENSVMISWKKYIYQKYQLIAELQALEQENPKFNLLYSYMWDPAHQIKTRPLAFTCWENMSWRPHAGSPKVFDITHYVYPAIEKSNCDNECGSGRYYYIHDDNKNVKGLMFQNGELAASYDYMFYGETACFLNSGVESLNMFRFSSEYLDKELGLIYYNYRHYNPQDGRWLSREPLGEKGSINLYSFLNNGEGSFDWLGNVRIPNLPQNEILDKAKRMVTDRIPSKNDIVSGAKDLLPEIPKIPIPPITPAPIEPNDVPKGEGCQIQVCCKPVLALRNAHCVIRFLYPTRAIGCRGGPTGNGILAHPNNGQSPHCKGCCGKWGNIVAGCGSTDQYKGATDAFSKGLVDDLEDADKNPDKCHTIETADANRCDSVLNCIIKEMDRITKACYNYDADGANSNTTWQTAFKKCLNKTFDPPGFQPGSDDFSKAKNCLKKI